MSRFAFEAQAAAAANANSETTGVMSADDWSREVGLRRPHRVLDGIGVLLTEMNVQFAPGPPE